MWVRDKSSSRRGGPRRATARALAPATRPPLRTSRAFRLLWIAGTVFYLGGMVSYVALPYQLYHLTGSNFAVGALGLIQLFPLIVCGLYGGVLADRVDRRKVLVGTGIGQCLLTAVLLLNAAASQPSV